MNGSKISTYGTRTVKIIHSATKIPYFHPVILCDLNEPILGFDFLIAFKLDLRWNKGKCSLVDSIRNQSIPLKMSMVNKDNLNLALVSYSYKQYSQERSVIDSQKEQKEPIPPDYKEILDKFPEVQKINFKKSPRHGVIHEIDTGSAKPCRGTVRPLMAGSKKERDVKKVWFEMEELGIVEKIKKGEPVLWSSAMHIAPKADGSLRPVGDYRALNDRTLHDSFPLPCLKNEAPKLRNSTIFSKIDLFRAYYQIELSSEAQMKTVVLTPFGPYKYK